MRHLFQRSAAVFASFSLILLQLAGVILPVKIAVAATAPGHLTLVKNAVGGSGTFSFTLTKEGEAPVALPDITTEGAFPSHGSTGVDIDPNTNYTLNEVAPSGGWQFLSVNCVYLAGSPGGGTNTSSSSFNIRVQPGETVLCTYGNILYSSITVSKNVVASDGITDVSDNHPFHLILNNDSTSPQTVSENASYTYENLVAGQLNTIEESSDPDYDFVTSNIDEQPNTPGIQVTTVAGQNTQVVITNKQHQSAEQTSNTIVVRPSNMQGWVFNSDDTPNPVTGTMVTGPAPAPLETGSAQLSLTGSTDHQALSLVGYQGTRLADISKLEYSTYRTSGGDALATALQFNIDSNLTDTTTAWQGRLIYEPYYTQTVNTGAWQTWNALNDAAGTGTGNWWFSNGTLSATCSQANPCTWAEVLAAFPNAGIHATFGAVNFKAGSGWNGFEGNVDQFKIGAGTNTTTYDFEPDLEETTGSLVIKKYTCPAATELSRAVNGPNAEGAFTLPTGCGPQAGVNLGYTYQADKTDNSAPYLGTGAGELFTSAATDNNGEITFSGLSSTGRYNVAETDANGGWLNPKPDQLMALYCYGDAGGGDDNYDITFVPNDGTTNCVVYNKAPVFTVSGSKFNDLNSNGTWDAGEPALQGWDIYSGHQVGGFRLPTDGTSTTVLGGSTPGQDYLIRVSGTFNAGDGLVADARYSQHNATGPWTDAAAGHAGDPAFLDLQRDGIGSVDWGSYNSSHVYWYKFTGDGSNLVWKVNDSAATDNTGTLQLFIFQVNGHTTTAADGSYSLPIPQGYAPHTMVAEGQQDGWVETTPANITPGDGYDHYSQYGVHFLTVDGQNYSDLNFGNHLVGEPAPEPQPEPQPEPETCNLDLVSDGTEDIGDGRNAVATYVHPAWTNAIGGGATWIWSTAQVANPTEDSTVVFTKTFDWTGTASSATLQIAADNNYSVKLNGETIAEVADLDNFHDDPLTWDTYTSEVLANLHSGSNTLEITVHNLGVADSTFETNPSGLLYRLQIGGTDCGGGETASDEYDFGDAPENVDNVKVEAGTPSGYPTLLSSNGARHVIVPGFYLGAGVDAEDDGQPTVGADGDDTNGTSDEDGVLFDTDLNTGESTSVQVVTHLPVPLADVSAPEEAAGYLNAWIDWNRDGDWDDVGEKVFDEELTAGLHHLPLNVPADAANGETYARFRWSSVGGTVDPSLTPESSAPDGEVEDYRVNIISKAHLTIKKIAEGGNGIFDFSIRGEGEDNFQDFSLETQDGSATSKTISFAPGSYDVTETVPQGWTLKDINCGATEQPTLKAQLQEEGQQVNLESGDDVTCTFTNVKDGTLIVKKVVVNDNGGTASADDFSFQVDENTPIAFQQNAENPLAGENDISVEPGTYTVTEPTTAGYVASLEGCSEISLDAGETATCTITNNDVSTGSPSNPETPNTPAATGGGGGGGGSSVLVNGGLLSDGGVSDEGGLLSDDALPNPDAELTRGYMARMMIEMLGIDVSNLNVTVKPYPDVRLEDANIKYIAKAKELDIMHGYGNGFFRPNSKVATAEALITLKRALNVTIPGGLPLPPVTDLVPGAWYIPIMKFGYAHEMYTLYSDGTARPGALLNRAQFNVLLAEFDAL